MVSQADTAQVPLTLGGTRAHPKDEPGKEQASSDGDVKRVPPPHHPPNSAKLKGSSHAVSEIAAQVSTTPGKTGAQTREAAEATQQAAQPSAPGPGSQPSKQPQALGSSTNLHTRGFSPSARDASRGPEVAPNAGRRDMSTAAQPPSDVNMREGGASPDAAGSHPPDISKAETSGPDNHQYYNTEGSHPTQDQGPEKGQHQALKRAQSTKTH